MGLGLPHVMGLSIMHAAASYQDRPPRQNGDYITYISPKRAKYYVNRSNRSTFTAMTSIYFPYKERIISIFDLLCESDNGTGKLSKTTKQS